MAPRKGSASSSGVRKHSKSSAIKSTRSSPTLFNKVTIMDVQKSGKTSPLRSLIRVEEEGHLKEATADGTHLRPKATLSPRKQTRFDKRTMNEVGGLGNLQNTSGPDFEDELEQPAPKPTSPRKPGRPPGTRKKPAEQEYVPPTAQVDAAPNKPSYRRETSRPRNNAKPDPAKGEGYEIIHNAKSGIFDQREMSGYLSHYEDLYVALAHVQEKILELSKIHFGFEIEGEDAKTNYLVTLSKKMSDELVRYAGVIAVGGPAAVAGWEEIFLTAELRTALAAGIIWQVLKQHVFKSLWFGASEAQLKIMEQGEFDMKSDECGFIRNAKRVKALRAADGSGSLKTSRDFSDGHKERVELIAGICTMLCPLLGNFRRSSSLPEQLAPIISTAVKLHHAIRLDSTANYHWVLTLKDEVFDSAFVRISSEAHWDRLFGKQHQPVFTIADPDTGLNEQKLDRIKRYGFLSRIVVFDPLEAYRRGGWREENRNTGQRRKLICKGAVAARWGATRKVVEGNVEGEFVELKDCRGQLGKAALKWWNRIPCDPAWGEGVVNVPVLGESGTFHQPDLHDFKPRLWSTI